MDIISYGIASKAAKQEQYTRNDVLGIGVEGTHPHVKARINNIEQAIQGVVAQADKLIVNDAINIMKAHAKLNAVAKSMKYKMHNMIFDDLLDLSGIDTTKSSGYVHDATNGLLKAAGSQNYTIITISELTDYIPTKAVLVVEEKTSDDITPIMTSNTSPSPYVISRKDVYGSTTESWMAFDGNPNTLWHSNTKPSWIQIDFGEQIKIDRYSIQAWTSNLSSAPKDWKLEGSNTGQFSGEQVLLHQMLGASSWRASEVRTYTIATSDSFRYYRLTVDSVFSTSSLDRINIAEIKFYQTFEGIAGKYFISRDNGVTWEPITPETLFYFNDNISPKDNKIRLKAELPANTQLLNYALTWV
jgi:F5/8 type C domain